MPSFPRGQDARQIVSRDLLQQVFPNLSGRQLDELLRSIDKDLQVPMRMDASASPDLTVTIGPAIVNNTVSGRQKSIPHVNNAMPAFASGTITFPSADGGTITVSPGSSLTLSCPLNNYVKVLVSLDSSGNLVVTVGAAAPTMASATVPSPVANCLAIGYIVLLNSGGTIQPVNQSDIFQFAGGGGGSSAVQAGFANEEPVGLGATSVNITFASPLPGVNYVAQVGWINELDPNPQYQDLVITNKTVNGFTVQWNAPTDTANYSIGYAVPVIQEQIGEPSIPLGATSLTVSIPIALSGTNYIVIPSFTNLVDASPQFQTPIVVARTDTTFTVEWNSPTDSANYRLSYRLAVHQ